MKKGINSKKSFTFYLKNPTSQKQSLNLFKLGSSDNPTIKQDAFYQDGDGSLLDIGFAVTKVLYNDDGSSRYILADETEVEIYFYDEDAASHTSYVYNVSGNSTSFDDVIRSFNAQSNTFTKFGFNSSSGSNIFLVGNWATNKSEEFCNSFKISLGEEDSQIGAEFFIVPIGEVPVSMPRLSDSMIQVTGQNYEEKNISQIGAPIGADPFKPFKKGSRGKGLTSNMSITSISSNEMQLQECISFNRADANGNAVGSIQCPIVDPYQKQNVNNINTNNIIFDGDTKMSYSILASTTTIQTFSYSQDESTILENESSSTIKAGEEFVEALEDEQKEEKEEKTVGFITENSNSWIWKTILTVVLGVLVLYKIKKNE